MYRFRWKNKMAGWILALGTLTLASGAEVHAKVCEDDEYLLCYSGYGSGLSVFDSEGEYKGNLDAYLEVFGLMKVPEHTVIVERRDDVYLPFSFAQMRNLPAFSAQSCVYAEMQNYYAVADSESNTFVIYDEDGAVRYQLEMEMNGTDDLMAGFVLLEGGFAAAVSQGEQFAGILFDEDGNALRELSDLALCRAISQSYGIGEGIGSNVVIWGEDFNRLVNMDGETLMTAENIWTLSNRDYDMRQYAGGNYEASTYAAKRENGITTVFDSDLTPILSGDDLEYQLASGFMQGVVYEELGNRVCQGFVTDGSGAQRPYAMDGGKAYILTSDRFLPLLEVDLGEGENVLCYNDSYMVIKKNLGDGQAKFTAYEIGTWEEFYSYTAAEYEDNRMLVSGDRICIVEIDETEDSWMRIIRMYDGEGELTYDDKGQYFYIDFWGNDLWYLHRGIYRGLVDGNGSWQFKVTDWSE